MGLMGGGEKKRIAPALGRWDWAAQLPQAAGQIKSHVAMGIHEAQNSLVVNEAPAGDNLVSVSRIVWKSVYEFSTTVYIQACNGQEPRGN